MWTEGRTRTEGVVSEVSIVGGVTSASTPPRTGTVLSGCPVAAEPVVGSVSVLVRRIPTTIPTTISPRAPIVAGMSQRRWERPPGAVGFSGGGVSVGRIVVGDESASPNPMGICGGGAKPTGDSARWRAGEAAISGGASTARVRAVAVPSFHHRSSDGSISSRTQPDFIECIFAERRSSTRECTPRNFRGSREEVTCESS